MGPEVDRLGAYIHPSSATVETSLPIFSTIFCYTPAPPSLKSYIRPCPPRHSNLGKQQSQVFQQETQYFLPCLLIFSSLWGKTLKLVQQLQIFLFFLRRERDCGEGKVRMDDGMVSLSLKSKVTLKSDKNS